MYQLKKSKIAFLLLSCLVSWQVSGQYPSFTEGTYIKAPLSPNATSLGTYGDVPVDLFTGTPSISIPIQTIQYEGMSVPISLSYHASGIKAGERPGWGGLGWDIITGGQINRKVKWMVDEYYNRKPGIGTKPDKGYYFIGKSLDRPDWNTTAVMQQKMNFGDADSLADNEPDEFEFSFGGYSGSFYRSEKGTWKVKSKQNIQLEVADEMDNSGFFRLYLLNPYLSTYESGAYEPVQSVFTRFTITTPDGFRYIFGGDTSSIEFSRPGSDPDNPFDASLRERSSLITANTWYLTKIITPANDEIVFNYRKGLPVFTKSFTVMGTQNTQSTCYQKNSQYSASVIVPSYLTSIETPVSRVEFKTSPAIEPDDAIDEDLLPPTIPDAAQQMVKSVTANWGDLSIYWTYGGNNTSTLPKHNRQLDTIKFFDKLNGIYTHGVKLFQRSSTTLIRTLDSLMIFDCANINNSQKYTFSYSNIALLPVTSGTYRKDHWGYYNGYPQASGWPIRTPNEKSLYGLINKITYPTGGETQFEFEQAEYMYAVKVDPNAAIPVYLDHEEGKAGNRIKKTTHIPFYGALPVTREYHYQTDYATGGTLSSGILAAYPKYQDDVSFHNYGTNGCGGDFYLTNRTDDASEWLGQTKGGIITYSEVTEKNADGSFVVHKFTNNDNAAYRDEIHDNYAIRISPVTEVTATSNYRLTSNDLERGQPLTESYYNNLGSLVKQLSYEYRNAPARKNEYVKAFAHKSISSCNNDCNDTWGVGGGPRGWTYRIYTYKNPLKKVTESDYNGTSVVTKTTNYAYDEYGNKVSTVVSTSDGRRVEEDTKYNSHPDFLTTPVNADAIGVHKLFTQYKIKNYPVEQVTLIGQAYGSTQIGPDNMLKGTLYHYDPDYPLVSKVQTMELAEPFVPLTYDINLNPVYHFNSAKISGGNFTYDSRYRLQMQALSYTASPSTFARKYTALEQNTRKEAYTWDYLTQYTASMTQNAVAADVAFNSFEGSYLPSGSNDDNKGNWIFDKSNIAAGGFTGSKCIQVSSSIPITSRYLLAGGRSYRLSFWAKGGVPVVLLNGTALPQSYAALKQAGDWSYYSISLVGNGQTVGIKGSSLATMKLDEVRLHPEDARMKSYTFDSGTGNPTTITDETGITSFYTYDGLGRLLYIKDEQGHILKKYTYQLQGAE